MVYLTYHGTRYPFYLHLGWYDDGRALRVILSRSRDDPARDGAHAIAVSANVYPDSLSLAADQFLALLQAEGAAIVRALIEQGIVEEAAGDPTSLIGSVARPGMRVYRLRPDVRAERDTRRLTRPVPATIGGGGGDYR